MPITSDSRSRGAIGSKVSDVWAVPLCASNHQSLHTVGDEEKWRKAREIYPIVHAERLWQISRGDRAQAVSKARELILRVEHVTVNAHFELYGMASGEISLAKHLYKGCERTKLSLGHGQ